MPVLCTPYTIQKLNREYSEKQYENSAVNAKIDEVGTHDTSENAAYQTLKAEQRSLLSRMSEITDKLDKSLQAVPFTQQDTPYIQFYSEVFLRDMKSGEIRHVHILGPEEVRLSKDNEDPNVISYLSDVSKALLGEKANTFVEYQPDPRNDARKFIFHILSTKLLNWSP